MLMGTIELFNHSDWFIPREHSIGFSPVNMGCNIIRGNHARQPRSSSPKWREIAILFISRILKIAEPATIYYIYSTPLYSTLLYSTPLYSTPIYSNLLHSTLLHSTPLQSIPLYSTLLHSNLLHSTPLHSNPIYSTLLHSPPIYSTPLYSNLLQSTPLYSTPLYSTLLHSTPLWHDCMLHNRNCNHRAPLLRFR